MNEDITDRLCGLIARLRQQHAAVGATLDEIEACLAEPAPEQPEPPPATARAAPANRTGIRPARPGPRPAAGGRVPPRPTPLGRR